MHPLKTTDAEAKNPRGIYIQFKVNSKLIGVSYMFCLYCRVPLYCGSVGEELCEFITHSRRRIDTHICEEQVNVLRRSIVHYCLENVLTSLGFEHLLHVLLIQWELLAKLVRLAEDVDRLLEVLSNQGDAVGAHFVDDTAICQYSLATDENTVNHGHRDGDGSIIDLSALYAEPVALFLHDSTRAARHALCCDDFDAEAALTNALNHIENDT